MKKTIFSVVISALFFSFTVHAAEDSAMGGDIAKTEKSAGDIYIVDHYGAKGTDFLLYKKVLQNDVRLKGWIVMIDGDKKARVIFYGRNAYGTGYTGYHQATFTEKDVTYQDISKQQLGKSEISLINARELVVSGFKPACQRRYNTAVIPQKDRIAVYMLASTTVEGEIPLGGSEVFYTDLKGEKVIEQKSFFNSCIALEKKENAVSLLMNQVIGNIPNEIIAFASIVYDIPFVVITPDKKTWVVAKGRIVQKDIPNQRRGR